MNLRPLIDPHPTDPHPLATTIIQLQLHPSSAATSADATTSVAVLKEEYEAFQNEFDKIAIARAQITIPAKLYGYPEDSETLAEIKLQEDDWLEQFAAWRDKHPDFPD